MANKALRLNSLVMVTAAAAMQAQQLAVDKPISGAIRWSVDDAISAALCTADDAFAAVATKVELEVETFDDVATGGWTGGLPADLEMIF